jgi:hypothetical protein
MLSAAVLAAAVAWPQVAPWSRAFPIDLTRPLTTFNAPILARDGRRLYEISCVGGTIEGLDRLSAQEGEDYIAPLSCNLADVRTGEQWLLGEDGTPHWHTRAQFHAEQLEGACARYPEFGLMRNFRLRGMKIRLQVSDVRKEAGELRSLVLHVNVANDRSATSSWTVRPGYLAPGSGNCSFVKKGVEPLMCRGPNGSWKEGCP